MRRGQRETFMTSLEGRKTGHRWMVRLVVRFVVRLVSSSGQPPTAVDNFDRAAARRLWDTVSGSEDGVDKDDKTHVADTSDLPECMDSEGIRHCCTSDQVARTVGHRQPDLDQDTVQVPDRRQEHN